LSAFVTDLGDMTAATVTDQRTSEVLRVGDSAQVRAWVRAAQAGDRDAFDALVSEYYRAVYRTAMAALQRSEDAEDVTQDAFVLAWRKVAAFRGDSSFKTWLLTIVWRQALDRRARRDRWWRRQHTAKVTDDGAADDGVETLVTSDADPERVAAGRARLRQVQASIAALSPKLRDTLLLASSGDYAYDEIAAMLDVPVGTVKWRVAEARRLLKELP
jgi:RNA polymerase sigma-70 factor (ECF subfamily)